MVNIETRMGSTGSALASLVSAIGTNCFERQLFNFLYETCGADHCAMYRSKSNELQGLYALSLDGTDTALRQAKRYIDEQHWRRDHMIHEAQHRPVTGRPILLRFNTRKFSDPYLRDLIYGRTHIMERMIVCQRADDDNRAFSILSVLRSARLGPFLADEVSRLESFSDVLISTIEKHEEVAVQHPSVAAALTSVHDVERCIAAAPESLPRREIEVCARILFGPSSAAIAADLGIGEQSVATYRKRAYQRLGVASRRDLMLWYLALWQARGENSARMLRQ
jgi:DNA-binding CsgD family transcriptional regulator